MFDAMNNMANLPTQEEMLTSITNMIQQTDDPMKKMLGQMALEKMQNQPRQAGTTVKNATNQVAQMQEDIATLIEMNREAITAYKTLQAEFQQLEQLNEGISSSLGACPCWGQNTACPTCNGRGVPGTREINEHNFNVLIQPFFEQLIKNEPQKNNNLN
jgi:proline dehydrogenase